MTRIESPCVLVCTMDLATDWCLGCGRSRDEIAGWTRMTPRQRAAVMARLPERMARLQRSDAADD